MNAHTPNHSALTRRNQPAGRPPAAYRGTRRAARVGAVLCLAGFGGGLAACGSADTSSSGAAALTFAVADQSMSAATSSYATVPDAMGYYEDHGVDLTFQPVESALAALQSVASGQADCTYASSVNALTLGAQDDAITIMGSTNGNIFRVVAPESSEMKTMADLEGKTVGTNILGAVSVDLAKAGMKDADITATDEQFLAVGYGSQAAEAFNNGDVEAYSGYDGPNLVIEGLIGEPFVELESSANELTGTSALVCATDLIEQSPEVAAGIWAAFFEGMEFSEENPEAAIRMHWDAFPASKSGGDEDAALATAVEQLSIRLEITGGPGSGGLYGQQTDEDYEALRQYYSDNGIISTEAADIPLEEIIDESLINEMNDFDEEGARQDAADWSSDEM